MTHPAMKHYLWNEMIYQRKKAHKIYFPKYSFPLNILIFIPAYIIRQTQVLHLTTETFKLINIDTN